MRNTEQASKSDDRYAELITRLTEYAEREPRRYRLRVGLLALLGYGYLGLILAILLGLLALVVAGIITGHVNALTIKGGFFLIVLIGIILRSLWVTIPRPEGIALTRQSVPALYAMLDQTTQALAAPRFHHVLLTDDYNAGVLQIPRFGLLGGQVNYLLLGMPLMTALSPRQFHAVIAHEVGHLSGNHSRFSCWIYRLRQTWMTLLSDLGRRRHKGSFLFTPFFRWYAPFFSAYSFVLARSDEYVADRCAAEIAGREATAAALVNVQVRAQFLEEDFWPGLIKQARTQADPPAAPFTLMATALHQPSLADLAPKWLGRALSEKTDLEDTHPALPDRLKALGYRLMASDSPTQTEPPLPAAALPEAETAAQQYLGPQLPMLMTQIEALWRQAVTPHWRKQHTQAREAVRKLQRYEERLARGLPLTPQEQWERAQWTAEYVDNAQAIPMFQEIILAQPENSVAWYALGALRLEENDPLGLDDLERAMALDGDAIMPACEAAFTYLKQAGRHDEAAAYQQRALARHDVAQLAAQERETLTTRDRLLPSELPKEVMDRLHQQLLAIKQIKAAYVARKAVQHLPEHPFYVIAVELRYPLFGLNSREAAQKVLKPLGKQLTLPDTFTLISLDHRFRPFRRQLRRMSETLLFRR